MKPARERAGRRVATRFSSTVFSRKRPSPLRSLEAKATPARRAADGEPSFTLRPSRVNSPRASGSRPARARRTSPGAGADLAGEADDLAALDVLREVEDAGRDAQAGDFGARPGGDAGGVGALRRRQLFADHHFDQLLTVADVGGAPRGDDAAVAEHGDPVAEVEHLVEAV